MKPEIVIAASLCQNPRIKYIQNNRKRNKERKVLMMRQNVVTCSA